MCVYKIQICTTQHSRRCIYPIPMCGSFLFLKNVCFVYIKVAISLLILVLPQLVKSFGFNQPFHMRAGYQSSVENARHHTAELTTSTFLCGLVSSVGMAAGFSARRWVPFAEGPGFESWWCLNLKPISRICLCQCIPEWA